MKKIMIETLEPGDPRIAQLAPEHIAAFAAQAYRVRTKTEARKWLSERPHFARQIKAKGKSREWFADTVVLIADKRHVRRCQKPTNDTLSSKLLEAVEKRLTSRLDRVFPLRVSQSSWGGSYGTASVELRVGKPSDMTMMAYKQWSDNGKWCGNVTRHTLKLNPLDTFAVIGGMLTVFPKGDTDTRVKPCTWFVQRRGFEFSAYHGWLIEDYHSEAATKEEALAEFLKKRARATLFSLKKKWTPDTLHEKVRFCRTGMEAWANANGINLHNHAEMTGEQIQIIVNQNPMANLPFKRFLAKIGVRCE